MDKALRILLGASFALSLSIFFSACNQEKKETAENSDSLIVKGEAPETAKKDGVLVEDTAVKKQPEEPVVFSGSKPEQVLRSTPASLLPDTAAINKKKALLSEISRKKTLYRDSVNMVKKAFAEKQLADDLLKRKAMAIEKQKAIDAAKEKAAEANKRKVQLALYRDSLNKVKNALAAKQLADNLMKRKEMAMEKEEAIKAAKEKAAEASKLKAEEKTAALVKSKSEAEARLAQKSKAADLSYW
jgi:hypothetical protein